MQNTKKRFFIFFERCYIFISDEIGEVKRYVSDIIVHPKFGVRPRDSDVALIKLNKPVVLTNKIKLACLPAVNETVAEGKQHV